MGRNVRRANAAAPTRQPRPMPRHQPSGTEHLAQPRRHHRRPGVPRRDESERTQRPRPEPRINQQARSERRRPRRHRPTSLLRALPTCRFHHLRPPTRRKRPSHRPPITPPLPGHHRRLRPHQQRLDRQRRHNARPLNTLGVPRNHERGDRTHGRFHRTPVHASMDA